MAKSGKFGTFQGVFTPSILTILGVIMYLRLPFIVGQAGLLFTIGIIAVAHIISATTGLSVSSIATDKKVKAGGTYYMISRSLGLPIGGTLGLALFVGLSFSVSLYIIGFAESFLGAVGLSSDINTIRITGSIVLLAVTIITFVSTSLAMRMQYFIMAAIILSLISIFFGKAEVVPESPVLYTSSDDLNILVLFGIFFPAVTGFEAGVSMSGDLADPKKSIPSGSILAIIVGFVVYVILTIFLSYTVDRDLLINDKSVLINISKIGELVLLGIWGATISSALGSILGAPRILQATAVDKITPRFFAKGYGATNEPRNALMLTFIIAWLGILIGELDVIARIVSIFFITTYGFLNLSCAFEAWTSADFRPSFKTPIWVSLLGAAACFLVMIQLDFVATIGATVILGLLFLYLKRKELTLQSGDAWSGVWASLVKTGLERLNKENLATRNWRPNTILFSGGEKERPYLSELGLALSGKLGILSSFELVESDKPLLVKTSSETATDKNEKRYFYHKIECRDIYSGMNEISRVYGFSGIEPNTILMGWSKREKNRDEFINLLKSFQRNSFNSIFLSYDVEKKYGENKSIDIWWSGKGRNISLAINLLRHITSSSLWKEARIRLLVINPDNTQQERIYKSLERITSQFRINLVIKVINNGIDQLSDKEIITQESDLTDLTVIGIEEEAYDDLGSTIDQLNEFSEGLRTCMFINASATFQDYDIHLSAAKESSESEQNIVALPELNYSKYHEIADDIRKIDEHGRKQIDRFNQKVFSEYFAVSKIISEELKNINQYVSSNLEKIKIKEDRTKNLRLISKTRSDFYFKTKQTYENWLDSKIEEQGELIESGIGWYVDQIDKNITRFPKKLKIRYFVDDLKPKKGDSGKLRWLKFRKRFFHPFAKTYIAGMINYREIVQYFLRDNRYHFLYSLLEQFKISTHNFNNQFQSVVSVVEDKFDKLEKSIEENNLTQASVKTTISDIDAKVNQLLVELKRIERLYQNRLHLEFRKNIQYLNNELEKVNINSLIKNTRRGKSYYSDLKKKTLSFANEWVEENTLAVNKNFLELIMFAFRDRVFHEASAFDQTLTLETEIRFSKVLDELKLKLEKIGKDPSKMKDFKIQKLTGNGQFIIQDFDDRSKKLLKAATELPEKVTISHIKNDEGEESHEVEVIDIPVSRIAQHFLESEYLGPVMENLQRSSETIKNLIFNVNDLLSLTKFNLDNIDSEKQETNVEIQSAIDSAIQQIETEQERVNELINNLISTNESLLDELFTFLSPYKMPESTKDLSYLLRGYQSKKVMSRFGSVSNRMGNFFKKNVVQLLFSRSQGILLAQKMAEENRTKSINEKILDIVDKVTPDFILLDRLPHYYQNLFSGRSNIGENFWIKRTVEEAMFKKAYNRYKNGYQGGIIFLGERNSGKTSQCLHFTKKHFRDDRIYQVFPGSSGSADEEEFVKEIRKATMMGGSINEIMEALPNQCVMVIHDLELWWQRTNDGLANIKMIEWMINEYSYKCLFVFNINPFAYQLINKLHPIEKLFISSIKCQPFSSDELMELIISRHRSSGMQFYIGKKEEGSLSDIRMANLFNSYFNYSEGNPGVALNAWLANINTVSAKEIHISTPSVPPIKAIDNIPDDWKVALVQFIIHKRLSFDDLEAILGEDRVKVGDLLISLSRSGLIKERSNSIYYVNPYVEPFIIKSFKQNNWL